VYNAGHNSSPSNGTTENSGGSGSYRHKPRHKKRGGGSRSWAAGDNPCTGLVQAWPMPFRAPGVGMLGPRLSFQPQQAMTAQHLPNSSGQLPPAPLT
jgi:hypothetical protein